MRRWSCNADLDAERGFGNIAVVQAERCNHLLIKVYRQFDREPVADFQRMVFNVDAECLAFPDLPDLADVLIVL